MSVGLLYRLWAQVVLAALLQDGNAFQFADLSLRGDREFVLHLGPRVGCGKYKTALSSLFPQDAWPWLPIVMDVYIFT